MNNETDAEFEKYIQLADAYIATLSGEEKARVIAEKENRIAQIREMRAHCERGQQIIEQSRKMREGLLSVGNG